MNRRSESDGYAADDEGIFYTLCDDHYDDDGGIEWTRALSADNVDVISFTNPCLPADVVLYIMLIYSVFQQLVFGCRRKSWGKDSEVIVDGGMVSR